MLEAYILIMSIVTGSASANTSNASTIPLPPQSPLPSPSMSSSVAPVSDEISSQDQAASLPHTSNPDTMTSDIDMMSSGEEADDDGAADDDDDDDEEDTNTFASNAQSPASSQDEFPSQTKSFMSNKPISPNPPSVHPQTQESESDTSSSTTSNSNSRSASPPPTTYDHQAHVWPHISSGDQQETLDRTPSSPGSSTESEPASPPTFADELAAALESVVDSATPVEAYDLPHNQKKPIGERKHNFVEDTSHHEEPGPIPRRTSERLRKTTASGTNLRQTVQALVDDETESSGDEHDAEEDSSIEEEQLPSLQEQGQEDRMAIEIDAFLPTPPHLKKCALEGRLQGKVCFVSLCICLST
jgi:hypothetical protein